MSALDNIRSRNEAEQTNDLLHSYSADGELYAYRDNDEHVVVCSPWDSPAHVHRFSAIRTAVVPGESLWTIPDNWEHQVRFREAKTAIYTIPETDVDVQIEIPHHVIVSDYHYYVSAVGKNEVVIDNVPDRKDLHDYIDRRVDPDTDEGKILIELVENNGTWERFKTAYIAEISRWKDDLFWESLSNGALPSDSVEPMVESLSPADFGLAEILHLEDDMDPEFVEYLMDKLVDAGVAHWYPSVSLQFSEITAVDYLIHALTQAGCTPAEALDYLMVELHDESLTAWAVKRRVDQADISTSIKRARSSLRV